VWKLSASSIIGQLLINFRSLFSLLLQWYELLNVVVRVPELYRRRLAPRNVLAVVVDVSSSGLYLLGTKEGLLERLYARNGFTSADNFIKAHDVPSSSLSLRSASMITSGSKQGFVSCHCKRYCIDKKCICR
jgi:hypothetical protein